MVKIEHYIFGSITIDGKDYKEDVLITTSGRVARRKTELSRSDHEISKDEMQDLLKQNPDVEVVIIGTGKSGVATVTSEAENLCKQKGIKLEIMPTDQAIGRFNWYWGKEKVAGIFHLTC